MFHEGLYVKIWVFPGKGLSRTGLPHSQLLSCLPAVTIPPEPFPFPQTSAPFSGKYLAPRIISPSPSFITDSDLSLAALNTIPSFSEGAGGGEGERQCLTTYPYKCRGRGLAGSGVQPHSDNDRNPPIPPRES